MTENEEKLRLAILENEALEKLYDQKQVDLERINFKYQKAYSEFLEIMRQLSRFRGEFLDNYSLRSKLLMTLEAQQKIKNLMETRRTILDDEQKAVDHFVQSSQELFDSKLINFIQNIRRLRTQKSLSLGQQTAWKLGKMHMKALFRQLALAKEMKQFEQRATLFEAAREEQQANSKDVADHKNRFKYPAKRTNSKLQGQLYTTINGIKCFVKYQVEPHEASCEMTVYSKIYARPLQYSFLGIEDDFNPRVAVRKLRINFNSKKEPYLTQYDKVADAYVDQFSDTLYYQMPAHIISYIYGGSEMGLHKVIYHVKSHSSTNELEVALVDPPAPLAGKNAEVSRRVIDPVYLFRYLRQLGIDSSDYELSLNPYRYRNLITTNILKQYLRDNLYIGEVEVETLSPRKALHRRSSAEDSPSSKGVPGYVMTSLLDNQGKNMKWKSAQITNLFKAMRENSKDTLNPNAATTARKNSKEHTVLGLFKLAKQKAQEYLQSKRTGLEADHDELTSALDAGAAPKAGQPGPVVAVKADEQG